MWNFFVKILEADSLSPHGICLLWRPELIWTHVAADALIGISYYTIPGALVYFVLKRRDVSFGGIFWCFAIFILACGTTHFFSILTLWVPSYGIEALVKVVTALASVTTAVALWRLLPDAIALPSPAQLRASNSLLSQRIAERDQALADLERSVSERVRIEEALRQSEMRAANASLRERKAWLQIVSDVALAGLVVIDADHRIRFANRAYKAMFHLPPSDIVGLHLRDVLPSLYGDTIRPSIDAAFAGVRMSQDMVYPLDGGASRRHFAATYERNQTSGGDPVVVVVITEVTSLKQSEMAFRASRDLLQSVLDGTMDAIFAKDSHGRYVAINECGARLLGIDRAVILGHTDEELRGPDIARPFVDQDREVIQSGLPLVFENTQSVGGRMTDLQVFKRPWPGIDGVSAGVVGVARDVTEQKLIAAERKDNAKRLLGAQEAERLRIARELHDQAGQDLTGLSFGLKQLEVMSNWDDALPRIRSLQILTGKVAENLHRTARQLRPTSLQDLGLAGAIVSHIADWKAQFGLSVDTFLEDLNKAVLGEEVELAIYRCVQESLNNITKHAGAQHVSIVAKLTPSEVRLIVEDDGVGFCDPGTDPTSVKGRLGIIGMEERMSHVDGMLTIESAPGLGTSVFIKVPRTAHVIAHGRIAVRSA